MLIYGLILESARDGICVFYGTQTWKRVVQELGLPHDTFVFAERYDDRLLERIAQ
ncbi:unnamed protein product, partial [Didymodactylos carnosus]